MVTGVQDLSIEQFRIRTVFDVFAFLHTAFTTNLRQACDERNRMSEIRSRGADGPVVDRQACPPKARVAGAVTHHMEVERNRSRSFAQFRSGIRRLVDAERVA